MANLPSRRTDAGCQANAQVCWPLIHPRIIPRAPYLSQSHHLSPLRGFAGLRSEPRGSHPLRLLSGLRAPCHTMHVVHGGPGLRRHAGSPTSVLKQLQISWFSVLPLSTGGRRGRQAGGGPGLRRHAGSPTSVLKQLQISWFSVLPLSTGGRRGRQAGGGPGLRRHAGSPTSVLKQLQFSWFSVLQQSNVRLRLYFCCSSLHLTVSSPTPHQPHWTKSSLCSYSSVALHIRSLYEYIQVVFKGG